MQAAQQLRWVVTGGVLTSHIDPPSSVPCVCLCMFVNSASWSVVTSGSAGFIASQPARGEPGMEPQSYLLERLGTTQKGLRYTIPVVATRGKMGHKSYKWSALVLDGESCECSIFNGARSCKRVARFSWFDTLRILCGLVPIFPYTVYWFQYL